ncbi:hypothetical protein [Flavobacterium ginsengisoli]
MEIFINKKTVYIRIILYLSFVIPFVSKSIESIPMTYEENDWEKLSHEATFNKKEYKISKSDFILGGTFFEFPNSDNDNKMAHIRSNIRWRNNEIII